MPYVAVAIAVIALAILYAVNAFAAQLEIARTDAAQAWQVALNERDQRARAEAQVMKLRADLEQLRLPLPLPAPPSSESPTPPAGLPGLRRMRRAASLGNVSGEITRIETTLRATTPPPAAPPTVGANVDGDDAEADDTKP